MTRHVTAAEINDACEAAFKQSADTYDLRVFDFARLIEATVSIREREACKAACAATAVLLPGHHEYTALSVQKLLMDAISERSNVKSAA